jgi:hypothetical protein
LYLFQAALLLTLAATLFPAWFTHLAGLFFLASNALLMKNLLLARQRYRRTNHALSAYAETTGSSSAGAG